MPNLLIRNVNDDYINLQMKMPATNIYETPSEISSDLEMSAVIEKHFSSNSCPPVFYNAPNLIKHPSNENVNITEELSSEGEQFLTELEKMYAYEHTSNNEQYLETEGSITKRVEQCETEATPKNVLKYLSNGNVNMTEELSSGEEHYVKELENMYTDEHSSNKKHCLETKGSSKKKVQQCPTCPRSFNTSSKMILHMKTHLEHSSNENLNIAEESSSEEEHYINELEKMYANEFTSNNIECLETRPKRIEQCPSCSKSFDVPSKMIRHMKTHLGVKPYVCQLCSKAFLEKQNFTAHQQVHSKEKPHICNICQRAFGLKSNLTRHLRSHEKEKKCSECGVVCWSEKKLAFHIRHHQKNLHKCTNCKREFKKKSNLKRHLQTHCKARKYPCDKCDYRASRKYHLERHVRRNHPE